MNILSAAVLAILTSTVPLTAARAQSDGFGNGCVVDDAIAPADRDAIGALALAEANSVLTDKGVSAYATATDDLRAHADAGKFAALSGMVAHFAPIKDIKVAHIYLIDGAPGADKIACGASPDDPDSVLLMLKPGFRQAHVVVQGASNNNLWAFTFWFIAQDGTWRLNAIDVNPSATAGHDSADLLRRARAERGARRTFNATLLYIGARILAERGQVFLLHVVDMIRGDLADFSAPEELRGKPPYQWTLNGKTFEVARVNFTGVEGKLGIEFILPHKSWTDDRDADVANRDFLDAFRATHPDAEKAFGFLNARALKPDGSGGFATVYVYGEGFADKPPVSSPAAGSHS